MASMTQHERAELDELRQRVEALEARVARLGQPDDDTYPVLCARAFELQDEGPDGELRARGWMHVDENGIARLTVMGMTAGDAEMPNGAILGADDNGSLLMLMDKDTGGRLQCRLDEDGSPRVLLHRPDGELAVEIVAFDNGAGVHVMDTQGRSRVEMIAGGDQEDRALLSVKDGEGTEGFRVNVAAIGEDGANVGLDGWPQWFGGSLERAWQRINEIEKRLGGDAA